MASQTIAGPIAAHSMAQIFALSLLGSVTASGGGPTVTVSGFANANYSFKVQFTGATTFTYSLNGGTSASSSITLPSSGIYTIPGTGGVTVHFGAGTYSSSDSYTWSSTASSVFALTSAANDVFPLPWWGTAANAQQVLGGSIAASSATLTVASGPFAAGDVGKSIVITGAGSNGDRLTTSVLSYTSATQVRDMSGSCGSAHGMS